ncbi:hypothetical protein Vi05172_g3676 [Venturia inaequalis]|nr:hypothetical protein Vi05172_g3676 [Venturia inaequalis]
MLKGAPSFHVKDYPLEIEYGGTANDDLVIIETVTDSFKADLIISDAKGLTIDEKAGKSISLFDTSVNAGAGVTPMSVDDEDDQSRYAHPPLIENLKFLQVPHVIPPLFSFSRPSIYPLVFLETTQKAPASLILKATSAHGLLELEVPIDVLK